MNQRVRFKFFHILSIIFMNYFGLSIETDIRDLYSDSHHRKGMKNIGHKTCIRECNAYNNQTCASYRYDWNNFICVLQEETVVGSGDDNHWVGERSDLSGIVYGPCSYVSCNKKEKCVVLHGGKTTCVIFACDAPPSVPNAVVDDGGVHVTSIRSYSCISGYQMTGLSDVTCKASGSWTDVNFICNKGNNMRETSWKEDKNIKFVSLQRAFSLKNTNRITCAINCMEVTDCVSFVINSESFQCSGYLLNVGINSIFISEKERIYVKEPYEFSDVNTFTNCGKTGKTGPDSTLCQLAYQSLLWIHVSVSDGIQTWIVPATANYTIEAAGAAGGKGSGGSGGSGATIKGTFYLQQGTMVNVVCGQKGENSGSSESAGGGGGTFVYTGEIGGDGLLIAAGGGGGGGEEDTRYGYDGQSADKARTFSGLVGSNENNNSGIGYGGVGGTYSVAGAGWYSDGGNMVTNSGNPGTRWTGGTKPAGSTGTGGFGGGASGCYSHGGGGGGGYTGGWGSNSATRTTWGGSGAGSFNKGNDQVNTAGSNSGHGYVTITKL